MAGERIYNLEKSFNYKEGFRRNDDILPERFYTEPLTIGVAKDAVVNREAFAKTVDGYYDARGWDKVDSKPLDATLTKLGLALLTP